MYLDVGVEVTCGGSGLQDEQGTKQYINNIFIVCSCTRISNLESIKEDS